MASKKEMKEILASIPKRNAEENNCWYGLDGVDYYVPTDSPVTAVLDGRGKEHPLSTSPELVRMIARGDAPHTFTVNGHKATDDEAVEAAEENVR